MPMVVMEVALRNAWPATGQICSHSEKNTHRSEMVKSQKILTAVSALCKKTFLRNVYGRKKIARNIYPDDLTVDSFRRRADIRQDWLELRSSNRHPCRRAKWSSG
jgi:hypothetical protein